MTLVDQVVDKIDSGIAVLQGRVDRAAAFAAMTKSGEMPQSTPAVFVLPLGFDARDPELATGAHVQRVFETVAVILVIDTAGDGLAARALPEMTELSDDIVTLIAGWVPDGAIAPVAVKRGRLIDITAGAIFYQLEFSLEGTLRL